MKPHKHAELIKAWADGAEIQIMNHSSKGFESLGWMDMKNPDWSLEYMEYRIKSEPKPDVVRYLKYDDEGYLLHKQDVPFLEANAKFIWDGETRKLKSAEVLK